MKEIEPVVQDLPRVAEFYRGRSIFLTGFSGFLGKALVEKFLWSCPDIKAIYVLIRKKKGLSCDERLKKIFSSDCFERVRIHREGAIKKVIAIAGDVQLPGLGISEDDRCKIISDVSIIIHSAASVRFDDPLTLAMDLNFKATKSMIDLATKIPKLEVFLYVSTAYSNCDRTYIEEKMYEPHANWPDMLKIRDKIDEPVIDILGAKCCGNMPNTYVFTKSLAEHMVYDYGKRIPVIICRPSIVINSINEPERGWIANLNGPAGMMLGKSTGVIRTSLQKAENRLDYIPCDAVTRFMIWIILLKPYQSRGVTPVYNVATKDRSPLTNEIENVARNFAKRFPAKYMLWNPIFNMTSNYAEFYIHFMLYQFLPAVMIDLILKLLGKKTGLIKLQKRIFIAMSALRYFTMNHFVFDNENCYFLQKYIHPDDEEEIEYVFNKNDDFVFDNYMFNYLFYGNKRFLKQTPDDYDVARRNYSLLKAADLILKSGFYIIVTWLIYKYEVIQILSSGTFNFITNF